MKSFMLISIPKERYDHMVESYSAVVAENERLKDKLKRIDRLVKEYDGTGKRRGHRTGCQRMEYIQFQRIYQNQRRKAIH